MTDTHIGILGCGKIAERHLSAYGKFGDVRITVSDIDATKRAVADRFDVRWLEDPDELLVRDDIDAIDVCTPVSTHYEVVTEALRNNKHVFCEKPLARNATEAAEMQEVAHEVDRTLMVGYLYRFHPAFQFACEILDNGIIGDPYYGIFRVGGRGSHRAWKHKRDSGGGARNEMLVHMLDLAMWYFGEAERSEGLHVDTVLEERTIDGETVTATAEDLVVLNLDMDNGADVLCQSDLITPSYMNYVEIHGTNGSVWTSILDYFPAVVYCQEPRGIYDRGNNIREFGKVDLFEKELEHFIECLQRGTKPTYNSVENAVAVRKIIDDAFRGDTR